MSHAQRALTVLCWTIAACASLPRPEVAGQNPPASTATPPDAPDPQPESAQPSMHLVAVTDATDFALQPRIVRDDEVVVPMPPERAHLKRVEVALLVTRRDTGELMDQQKKLFRWDTQGPALRFHLPSLPGGDYLAEIRTTSTVVTKDGDRTIQVQLPDKAQVAVHSDQEVHMPHVSDFRYHFKIHHALGDTPELSPEDADLNLRVMELDTKLHNNDVIKITLDCWASSDGPADYNMQVSVERCKWVRSQVLSKALDTLPVANLIEAAHGEDNPPEPEPAGVTGDALRDIQRRNRVVILKVYTSN